MNLNELRHWLLDGLGAKVSFVEPKFLSSSQCLWRKPWPAEGVLLILESLFFGGCVRLTIIRGMYEPH